MAAVPQSVALWSPKGGVGKSVLAAALALKVAEQRPTVLIDGNPDNPDVTNLLQVPGYPNVTGWTPPSGRDDLERCLVRHSSRLWVLPGPVRYVEEGALTGPVMESVLEACLGEGFTVVVDLGSPLRDSTVAALDRVERVLVPVTPDLLSVLTVRRIQAELDLLRLPSFKFRVVANCIAQRQEITLEDIEAFSDFPIAGAVPSSPELAAAVNTGNFAVALGADTPVSRAVAGLAAPFLGAEPGLMPESRRFLGGLLAGLRRGGTKVGGARLFAGTGRRGSPGPGKQ